MPVSCKEKCPSLTAYSQSSNNFEHVRSDDAIPFAHKRRLRSAFAVALAIYICTIILAWFLPPWCDKLGYFASVEDKHNWLEGAPSPKIVFTGGSNLTFGLDSELVEKEIGRPVVNMALCLLLGMPYMLEEIRADLKPGDIVVLSPEYWLLGSQAGAVSPWLISLPQLFPPAARWIFQAHLANPARASELVRMTRSWYSAKWKAFGRLCKSIVMGTYSQEQLIIQELAASDARLYFNKNGDYFGHYGKSAAPPATPVNTSQMTISEDMFEQLAAFNAWANQHSIEVVFLPPASAGLIGHERAESQLKELHRRTGICILATPQRYSFPMHLFYDSADHLKLEGKMHRTMLAIQDLKNYMATRRSKNSGSKL